MENGVCLTGGERDNNIEGEREKGYIRMFGKLTRKPTTL